VSVAAALSGRYGRDEGLCAVSVKSRQARLLATILEGAHAELDGAVSSATEAASPPRAFKDEIRHGHERQPWNTDDPRDAPGFLIEAMVTSTAQSNVNPAICTTGNQGIRTGRSAALCFRRNSSG